MLIDWFTVGAQLLNFLVLVWLLKRFLYKPVLQAIEAREQRIAAALAAADAKNAEAEKARSGYESRNAEFDQQRDMRMAQLNAEIAAERQRQLADVRRDADQLRAKRAAALRDDAKALNLAIAQRAEQEVFAIARKTLSDLATVGLEAEMAAVFIRRMRALDDAAKATLATAIKAAPDAAVLRSAFELPPETQAAVQQALSETFATEVRLRFETASDLVSGIEFTANGQKLAWSIAAYLAALEQAVGDLLKQATNRAAQSASKPAPAIADPNAAQA
jgi:F-type H+-transporting ATPase subunit b